MEQFSWCEFFDILRRQGGVLSPMLFSVYVDDSIRFLRHSGYGTYIGSQFIGTILYADSITLLSGSCRGLQRMLDICAEFGHKWDISLTVDLCSGSIRLNV